MYNQHEYCITKAHSLQQAFNTGCFMLIEFLKSDQDSNRFCNIELLQWNDMETIFFNNKGFTLRMAKYTISYFFICLESLDNLAIGLFIGLPGCLLCAGLKCTILGQREVCDFLFLLIKKGNWFLFITAKPLEKGHVAHMKYCLDAISI